MTFAPRISAVVLTCLALGLGPPSRLSLITCGRWNLWKLASLEHLPQSPGIDNEVSISVGSAPDSE